MPVSKKRQELHRLTGTIKPRTKMKSGKDKTLPRMHTLAPYRAWENMKAACESPSSLGWSDAGAKGLSYSGAWTEFDCFWNDTKHGWISGAMLTRRDTSKGFYPDNVYWKLPKGEPYKELKKASCASGVWGLLLWGRDEQDPNKAWRVRLSDPITGKRVSKMWAIKKYGHLYAFMLAKDYLYQVLKTKDYPTPKTIDPSTKAMVQVKEPSLYTL